MKKLLIFIPCLFMLAGCQPVRNTRVELNQNASQILPVSALSIDKNDNIYNMTIESIRQDSLDGEATPAYFTVSAEDFDGLFKTADLMLASRLYLNHASVIIISKDIAQNDLNSLVESLLNRSDARLTLRIVVAHDYTPDEILKAPSVTDGISGMAISSLLNKRAEDGTVADFPMFRILDYESDGREIALPLLTLTKDGHVTPYSSIIITKEGEIRYA